MSIWIKNWPEEDRPREKLLSKGSSILTNAELLGGLLGSGYQAQSAVGLAKNILTSVNNDLHQLAQLSVNDLIKFKEVGHAKTINIISALELGRRQDEFNLKSNKIITCSKDVYEFMRAELMDIQYEEFWIILLKRNNEIIAKKQISKGGISGTLVDAKIVFKHALDRQASTLVLIHNHPSGNINASQTDINLTKKIKKAGDLLDISIIDHIIYTNAGYYSFVDHSLVF
jgi:DNA repair protein RadC